MFSLVSSSNEQATDGAPAVYDDGAPAPVANFTNTTAEVSVLAVSSLYAIMLCSHWLVNSTI
jgi:hypothetical protein